MELLAGKTERGGYTRKQLEEWGVSWPPQKGWQKTLIIQMERPPKRAKWTGDPANCELCGVRLTKFINNVSLRNFACWDHCHKCGTHRGWLCNLCNTREKLMPDWYLEKCDCPKKRDVPSH